MPTDPIKLINRILEPKTTASTKPADTAQAAGKADPAAAQKDKTAAAAKTGAPASGQTAAASQTKAYVVDQGLKSRMSGGGGNGTRTQELAQANAKDVQAYYESAAKTRKSEAAANAKADPLQGVLSDARGKTGNTQFSAAAQASLNKSAAYKEAVASRAADAKAGVSKIIGTA